MDQFNFVISLDRDFLDFIASMTGHVLSWPVAFLVAVFIFKTPLKALIGRIRRFKTPAGDVLLAEELRDIEREIAETDPSSPVTQDDALTVGSEVPVSNDRVDDAEVAPSADPLLAAPPAAEPQPRQLSSLERRIARQHALARWLENEEDASVFDPPARMLDDPERSVRIAWIILGTHLQNLLTVRGMPIARGGTVAAVRRLELNGVVNESFAENVMALDRARQEIKGSEDAVSPGIARQFWRNAARLWTQAEQLASESVPGIAERAKDGEVKNN